jgi:hypothetical protein
VKSAFHCYDDNGVALFDGVLTAGDNDLISAADTADEQTLFEVKVHKGLADNGGVLVDGEFQSFYLVVKETVEGGDVISRGVLLCADAALISLPKRYEAIFEEFNDNQKEVMRSGRLFIDNIREVQTERGTTVTFDLIKED